MSISRTMIGAATLMACLIGAGSALAVEAAARAPVNVRTGPGTSFGIVDQLSTGEVVSVTECAPSNFCFVERDGADGWVSANYLTSIEEDDEDDGDMEAGSGDNPDCSFGFVVGSGGPHMSISCGDGPMPMPPGPPEPPEPDDDPVTLSTGPISLPQTYLADLDDGSVGSDGGSDIWYEAVTEDEKYIVPRNGALLALGDGSNRGYAGCADEDYSSDQIPIEDMTTGTYVCVQTSEGRVSQFRVNGFTSTTMKLGYTTWDN